jgi:hypothetical protein
VFVFYLGNLDLSSLQRHLLKEDDLVKYHLHVMEVGGGEDRKRSTQLLHKPCLPVWWLMRCPAVHYQKLLL